MPADQCGYAPGITVNGITSLCGGKINIILAGSRPILLNMAQWPLCTRHCALESFYGMMH